MNIVLKIADLRKIIATRVVLSKLSFSISKGQRVGLCGETGSGKSTLLKIIAGLADVDGGQVLLENEKMRGPNETLVPGHPAIAYLSQLFDLPKFLRVDQVLEYANQVSDRQALHIFKLCRIQHLLQRKTDELSGGERQRIALARQLVTMPKILLLDEPFSNLDVISKSLLKDVLNDLITQLNLTCVLVSHDPMDVLSWADHILILRGGKLIQQGSPQIIYNEPISEYVAGLFGKFTWLSPVLAKKVTGKKYKGPLMLRPEMIKLKPLKRGSAGLKGTVKSTIYYGAFYEVCVISSSDFIYVHEKENRFQPQQEVMITLV